ncbi:uncharacterized protein I303_101510 [Kwoniella dejecticola CBS 10117]|uniref:Uncharacterized protein n=1 Tax=Kwoniella dejecticola CBS 10117 TaxID=1296121 RepID=A0A1A6ADJ0_9TREE|nr:uncharacterized protein I303_02357 [Kwoniella dejecticola CBS 10117]OBR88137.1 hypothetical protein I303_02357 [Kwoniella dejecticola CBS 10117]
MLTVPLATALLSALIGANSASLLEKASDDSLYKRGSDGRVRNQVWVPENSKVIWHRGLPDEVVSQGNRFLEHSWDLKELEDARGTQDWLAKDSEWWVYAAMDSSEDDAIEPMWKLQCKNSISTRVNRSRLFQSELTYDTVTIIKPYEHGEWENIRDTAHFWCYEAECGNGKCGNLQKPTWTEDVYYQYVSGVITG